MKKFIALLVCCCCTAVFAGDVEVKDVIKKSAMGAETIRGWGLNRSSKFVGTGKIVQGSEKDEKAFTITAGKARTAFYSYAALKAKAGDKIKISAEVKGKGIYVFGFYTYRNGNKFFASKNTLTTFTLTDKKQDAEFEFVIPNGIKGEITDHVRPFIAADSNSTVTIEDLEIEIDYKDR